ncbi:alanine racemase [Vibrio sp. 404]|uniref:Alanine racemase n=1 Tax=Vibrio marinisediminis TaxID=2758441 RepID=A0A7W2FN66_9VIBR|nr:alanine racemase [Vibrio marinisediminis]MBA5761165.1 alanine racemase [Vibrio marinisediminis]
MFLEALKKQNPDLIKAALSLFKQGQLLPDTTVIDVDQVIKNALLMRKVADKHGIKLFAMTKQFGRNPMLAKILINQCKFDGVVCVDFKEARLMAKHGLPIANVGHLVQPPSHMIQSLVNDVKPQVITVYSLDKVKQISDAALRANRQQGLLLKFFHPRDNLYTNQESGFPITELQQVVAEIQAMPNVVIQGVTHFPCFLYDGDTKTTLPTPNLTTLIEAKHALEALGVECQQINAPSATSIETIPLLAKYGCTHGEPGHSLTGTMPSNAITAQAEKIAMLYLSEVSHHYGDDSYCFAGGYYRRGGLENGLVYHSGQCQSASIYNDDRDSIDYHLRVAGLYPIGSPVIMAYRTQVFVTRSDVALVTGVSSNNPRVIATYDSLGNQLDSHEVHHG